MQKNKVWLISDTHFGHVNIYKFYDYDGNKTRKFDDIEECENLMIENWKSMVGEKDKIYHLGDVAMPRSGLKKLEGLPGRKILIKGNHDPFDIKDYLKYFEDVVASVKIGKFILSHYPIHPQEIPEWCSGNIHGHTHSMNVKFPNGEIDPLYINVCVEKTDYAPILFDHIERYRP